MTTHIEVVTNGMYVAEVKHNNDEVVLVGPGDMVRKQFYFRHGQENSYTVTERPATEDEIKAYQANKASNSSQ